MSQPYFRQGVFQLSAKLCEHIISDQFPFFYTAESTSDKFPYWGHGLVSRATGNVISPIWEEIFDEFKMFCKLNDIQYERILRAGINSTQAHPIYTRTDAHVDCDIPHKVMLVYLTEDAMGETIIFDKKFDGVNQVVPLNSKNDRMLKILTKYMPINNTAFVFDGAYYHAAAFPKLNKRRVVIVINFV